MSLQCWSDSGHHAWLGLSARLGAWVSTVSGRTDLVARIDPDLRPDALRAARPRPAACFIPALAEIHFDASRLLNGGNDDPERIDPCDPRDQAAFAALVGAGCHEAAHARHTRLAFPSGTSPRAAHWAMLLEEPRIEAKLIADRPADRTWLRASATQVVADGSLSLNADTSDTMSRQRGQAVRIAVLMLARVDSGVFDTSDLTVLRDEVVVVLGEDTLLALNLVWTAALALDDGDVEGMLACGQRIVDMLEALDAEDAPEPADAGGDPSPGESAPADPTPESDGDDGGDSAGDVDPGDAGPALQMPCGTWTEGDLPEPADDGNFDPWTQAAPRDAETPGDDPLGDLARAVADAVSADAAAFAGTLVSAPPVRDTAEQARQDRARTSADARAVFAGTDTHSRVFVYDRPPTPDENRETRNLHDALKSAQRRDMITTRSTSVVPRGKLVMRQAVRAQAQRRAGVTVTAGAWQSTQRRAVANPPLNVGLVLDVSPSMGAFTEPVASISYALATAVSRLSGTVASIAFNGTLAPLLRPGHAPRTVTVPQVSGGSTGCAQALSALDGQLRLCDGDGARLAVVVTDGELPDTDLVTAEVTRLASAGVTVMWVTFSPADWHPAHAVHVTLADPTTFGAVLGHAVVSALANA